jgi:glycosyltransferase involved in cell wall biosynthesis
MKCDCNHTSKIKYLESIKSSKSQYILREKKTIWVFNQFAGHPESGWGERHFYFAKYWQKAGYRVVIFSGSYNHMFRQLPTTSGTFTHEVVKDIEFCWVKVPKYHPQSVLRFWSNWVFAWRLLWAPMAQYGSPETIIVSSLPIFPILTAILLRLRNANIKVLFEIRDIWPLSLIYLANLSKWHPAVLFLGWFEKLGYRRANAVISLLPNARAHIESVAGKEVSFHYIPNGIDAELLISEPLEDEILQRVPKGKFIVGYAGTMGLANALESFMEAAIILRDYTDIHFMLVGEGYLKPKLIEMAGIDSNVTFISKIRKHQVQSMLQYFDVCFISWHPSKLYEHGVSANKYSDYMLAGKPVLDANNFIKDPVEISGCGIIVKPESARAIAEGVLKFYNMPEKDRKSMGNLGLAYVLEKHSIQYLALDYLKIITSSNTQG